MATCHTDFPSHHGERDVAEKLASFPDDALHLWFDVGYLPGVPQIDAFVFHERAGAFVIETKAIPMSAIEWQDFERLKIRGRAESHSAQRQAFLAFEGLRTYLESVGRKSDFPFIISTACFPLISRREWNEQAGDERLTGDYAERLIFAEDLVGGKAFFDRLATIWMNPPRGRGQGRPFFFVGAQLDSIKRHLHVRTRAERIATDQTRLRELERTQRQAADRDAPVGEVSRIVYTGFPGTGKTFRLMRIAIQHAIAGKRSLFLCFNKVLAADFRRLLTESKAEDRVEAWDLFDFLASVREARGTIDGELEGDYDGWAAETVQLLRAAPIARYDTVVVDEAQDLKAWALELIKLLTHEGSTICAAIGSGQELYGHEVDVAAALGLNEKKLRRVFRNRPGVFRFAQGVLDSGLKPEKVDAAVRGPGKSAELQAEFEKDDDELPRIEIVNDDSIKALDQESSFYLVDREAEESDLVKKTIAAELKQLTPGESRFDLLFLVPSSRGTLCRSVRAALDQLQVPYTDYVEKANRRRIAPAAAVRLCTYHSARGIEGTRVVVFGFTQIDGLARETGLDAATLAYVALSRASRDCVVVMMKSEMTHEYAIAAQGVLDRLARLNAENAWAKLPRVAEALPPYGGEPVTFYRDVLQLRAGDEVVHQTFGPGLVISVDTTKTPPAAEIFFEREGSRFLICDDLGLSRA